jgi:carotenoid cleavage dioxygenase-like enzyme
MTTTIQSSQSTVSTPAKAPIATSPEEAKVANPYTVGNFGPVNRELTALHLPISGELPKNLAGILMRNGPNPVGAIDDKHHWFVGDAMLHAITLEDGEARVYRNRWLRTPHIEQELGYPAAPRSKTPYGIQGSGNVNVIHHGGRVLALPEVGLPYELSRELSTIGEYDYDGRLHSSMTAHPKIDPITGELHFFGYDFGPVYLRYHRASRSGELVRTVDIDMPRSTMMHDFGVTQTRLVFMDLPVVFDLDLVAQGYRMPFRWDDSVGARLAVMPRDGESKDVRFIEIEPCYVYHVLNAYDDEARIVMDVIRYERTFDLNRQGPIEKELGQLVRWVIDPEASSVSTRLLDASAQEFPRINPRCETRPNRYGYALEVHPLTDIGPAALAFGGLYKHDLEKSTREHHDLGPSRSAGEGVFVPRGTGAMSGTNGTDAEDAGYVLAPVYDAATNCSDIVVLDAQNFSRAPLATIHLPVRIPFGFHGNFIPLS